MSDSVTIDLGLILLVASIVAMISRRMHLPYSVGLVAAGILLARAPVTPGNFLSPHGIFTILLPPLIFEAALPLPMAPDAGGSRSEQPLDQGCPGGGLVPLRYRERYHQTPRTSLFRVLQWHGRAVVCCEPRHT